jgi:hypothetical protein
MKSRIALVVAVMLGSLVGWSSAQNLVPPLSQATAPVVPPAQAPGQPAQPAAQPTASLLALPSPPTGGFAIEQITLRNKAIVLVRINRTTGEALVSFSGATWTKLAEKAAVPTGDYQVLLAQSVTDGAFETARFDRISGRTWVLSDLVWTELAVPQ